MVRDVTALGGHLITIFVTAASAGYLALRRKRGAALFILLAVGSGMLLSSKSEEHTSELQSLMRISYAVFCLKKNKKKSFYTNTTDDQKYTEDNKQLRHE